MRTVSRALALMTAMVLFGAGPVMASEDVKSELAEMRGRLVSQPTPPRPWRIPPPSFRRGMQARPAHVMGSLGPGGRFLIRIAPRPEPRWRVLLFEREESEIHAIFRQHADQSLEVASWT